MRPSASAPTLMGPRLHLQSLRQKQAEHRQRLLTQRQAEGTKSMQSSRGFVGHPRCVSCEWGSASASLKMTDKSRPLLVRSLPSRLRARAENNCQRQRLLTLLRMRRAGSALELLQHRILLDARRNDDARHKTEVLLRQVDRRGVWPSSSSPWFCSCIFSL